MISFTSRVKIVYPSYITKIDAQKVKVDSRPVEWSDFKPDYHSLITVDSRSLYECITTKIKGCFPRPKNQDSFFVKTPEHVQQIIDVFEKAKQPNAKNYTITMETNNKKFAISEY